MEIIGKRITGGPHKLDGNRYINCEFRNADLEFWGGPIPQFDGCSFEDCHFAFVNAAANTLGFIKWIADHDADGSFMSNTFPIKFEVK